MLATTYGGGGEILSLSSFMENEGSCHVEPINGLSSCKQTTE